LGAYEGKTTLESHVGKSGEGCCNVPSPSHPPDIPNLLRQAPLHPTFVGVRRTRFTFTISQQQSSFLRAANITSPLKTQIADGCSFHSIRPLMSTTASSPSRPAPFLSPWRDASCPPPWLFPAPVRTGRFTSASASSALFNVEVALDLISPYHFTNEAATEVLHYEMQTQLLGNVRGRLGSGRAGVYQGHYLKGVGRTPAAANWNDDADVYHGSGHLAVGSAIRERAITACLEARGLGKTIVPCVAVLLGRLKPAESRAVVREQSSSRPGFTAADSRFMALTAKPAHFARMSNFAFALDRFEVNPRNIGELFLDLEHFLQPPEARADVEGSPQTIVDAMEQALNRGMANFETFARAGLFWLYLESNFSLDGRFLDLETPVYFGQPFVGVVTGAADAPPELLGFEEFGFVGHWRGFLAWFKAKLELLSQPVCGCGPEVRAFLRELSRRLCRRFSAKHWLFDDPALIRRATQNLAAELGLEAADRKQLRVLAKHAFQSRVYSHELPLPDMKWLPVDAAPAAATPRTRIFHHAPFSPAGTNEEGRKYAEIIAKLSRETDARTLLRSL